MNKFGALGDDIVLTVTYISRRNYTFYLLAVRGGADTDWQFVMLVDGVGLKFGKAGDGLGGGN